MSDLKISIFDAGLAPLSAGTEAGKSCFMVESRGKGDRRKNGDRRKDIRFEDNRRQGSRRSRKTWEEGKNL